MDDSMSSGLGGEGVCKKDVAEARAGRSSTIFLSKEIFGQLQRHDVCDCSSGEQAVELARLGLGYWEVRREEKAGCNGR